MKKIILITLLLLTPSLTPFFTVLADEPGVLLEKSTKELLETINNEGDVLKNDKGRLGTLVDEKVLPIIDFEAMSKLTLAKHWKKASEEQRIAFVNAYQGLLAKTYTKSLTDFAGKDIKFFPNKTKIDGKYASVFAEYVPGNGQTNKKVKYSMRLKNETWLVYDVVIDGLSFIKNYRTNFGKEIQKDGLDALIERLRKGEIKES